MTVQIQLRRDTQANWSSANPVLADGEVGLETDTLRFKIGNGATTWASLPYRGLDGAPGGSVFSIDLDLGAAPKADHVLSFSHPGASPTQRVVMTPASVQPASVADDEIEMDPIVCAAGVSSADVIKVIVSTVRGGPISGVRRLVYTIA